MHLRKFLLFSFLMISIFIISCTSSKEGTVVIKESSLKGDTIALVGDEVIYQKEYEDFFIKNNGGIEAAKVATDSNKKQFLDLLVKYKLKVKEAYRQNYHNDPEVKKEILEYKRSLAVPYIIEREITEPNIKTWYERRKQNLQIAAILLRTVWSSPSDTLEKYIKAKEIIDSINKGVSFGALATRHSQFRNAQVDSGMLGFMTAGNTVPEFENVIFNLKIGQVCQTPIRLVPGYFIVKLINTEPRTGGRKLSHIQFSYTQNTREDSLSLMKKADSVYQRARSGEDFSKLVQEFSTEPDSKSKGGSIGLWERQPELGPKEFFDAAFSLKPGEVSKPVQTSLGIHIIKLTGVEPYPSYEESKDKLKEEYQSLKYSSDYQKFISKLKTNLLYSLNLKTLNIFYSKLDSNNSVNTPNWDSLVTNEIRKIDLFSISNKKYSVDTVIEMLKNVPDFKNVVFTPSGFNSAIEKVSEMLVMQYRADWIDFEYPEFRFILKDYVDGLLLYKAEQVAVWNKVTVNESDMRKFFMDHREMFKFPERVDVSEIFLASDSTAKLIHKQLTEIPQPDQKIKKTKKSKKVPVKLTFEELAEKFTIREGFKEKKGRWGLLSPNESALGMRAIELNIGEITPPLPFENGFSILKVNDKSEPRLKEYNECGPELSSKFQEYETKRIESLWIESLREIFPVKVNEEKLKTSFSNLKK